MATKPAKKSSRKIVIRPARSTKTSRSNKANIKVVGIGGGGGNAVSRMKERFIKGIEFIAINTDTQDLDYCNVHKKICIGRTITRGLGTGMNPELGRQAVEENRSEIGEALKGADLVFLTTGLGGGTGSGGSVPIAEIAREVGALTVAVVTQPFSFEGGQRARIAEEALTKLKEKVDTYIVIPNDKIFTIISKETSINKAFEAIDDVLRGAVQGIAELIAMPGIINVDFADVKTIMQGSGSALVSIGIGSGKDRGISAVNQVLSFPLLEISIDGAQGILFGVSGSRDMKMTEIHDIAKAIVENVDPSAKIIFGAYHDRKLKQGRIKVTLIATGFGEEAGVLKTSESRTGSLFGESPAVFPTSIASRDEARAVDFSGSENIENSEPEIGLAALRVKNEPAVEEEKIPEEKQPKKKTAEIWDIPAFLRKKKKR